jgi:hypothetical protein
MFRLTNDNKIGFYNSKKDELFYNFQDSVTITDCLLKSEKCLIGRGNCFFPEPSITFIKLAYDDGW